MFLGLFLWEKSNIFYYSLKNFNMAITILSAKEYGKKLKATIQASGKLGFTEQTAEELRLGEDNVGIKFGKDGEKLYLIRVGSCDEDAFKVKKSGMYVYVSTKELFDRLHYDYAGKVYMFDLVRSSELDDELQGEVYFMKQRTKEKKKDE